MPKEKSLHAKDEERRKRAVSNEEKCHSDAQESQSNAQRIERYRLHAARIRDQGFLINVFGGYSLLHPRFCLLILVLSWMPILEPHAAIQEFGPLAYAAAL
jgi:hypothetical protein